MTAREWIKQPPSLAFTIIIGAAIVICWIGFLFSLPIATAQERERPRPMAPSAGTAAAPKAGDSGPIPKDDSLFVWPQPEQGTQSLIVLRVVDGETVECGLIVPIMVKIKGVTAHDAKAPEAKAGAEALDKLIGGRLLPANLHGRERFGRIVADFWLGEKEGGWLSGTVLKNKIAVEEKSP